MFLVRQWPGRESDGRISLRTQAHSGQYRSVDWTMESHKASGLQIEEIEASRNIQIFRLCSRAIIHPHARIFNLGSCEIQTKMKNIGSCSKTREKCSVS